MDDSLARVMRCIHELHYRHSSYTEQEISDQPRI